MNLSGKTIAVTGVTGFLGTYIALELLKRGAKVRGVVRTPQKGAWLEAKGVSLKKADLMDPNALCEAFKGADAIVSNAALFTMKQASWNDFYFPNKLGTENVFNAAQNAAVRRLVQVSSVAVYRSRLPNNIPESTPRLTELQRGKYWNYAITKSLSEGIAWDLAAKYRQQLTVVRPGPIYGQRDKNITPFITKVFRWPFVPAPTIGFPAVHAGDVAKGIAQALETDTSIGKAYNLTGPAEPVLKLLQLWKEVSGSGPLLCPLPLPIRVSYDTSAAQIDLGFQTRSLREGISETFSKSIP